MGDESNVESKIKQNKNIIIGVVVIIVAAVIGWAMFYNVHDNGGSVDSVRGSIDSAAKQQRDAETKLNAIGDGLADSQRTVGELDKSNSAAEDTANAIGETNISIKKSIDDAAATNRSSEAILADSQRRLGISQQILEDVRKTAKTDEGSN